MTHDLFITIFAGTGVLLSIISLAISIRLTQLSNRTNIKPVIVFEFVQSKHWIVRNVGHGPAINVIVVQSHGEGKWIDPTSLPPLAEHDTFVVDWLTEINVRQIGARYTDSLGNWYSTTCQDDLSQIYEGVHIHFSEGETIPYWRRRVKQNIA